VAGYACAARLAELGHPVTLVGPRLPHDRPPLSKRALATGKLPLLADAEALARSGIEHVDGAVVGFDSRARRLRVALRTGADVDVHCEGPLVWATGLRHVRPPVAGLERAQLLATCEGFEAVQEQLAAGDGLQVVIVGAGLVGTEAAATLALKHEVTLVDVAESPLVRLHDPLPSLAREALAARGVRFLGGCLIEGVEAPAAGRSSTLRTRGHGQLAADVLIAATGTLPPAVLPAVKGSAGGVAVDSSCRVVGAERIWACGDCALLDHRRYGQVEFPHWDWARRMGRHAAEDVEGIAGPFDAEPFWFSTIGSVHLQEVGLAARAVSWQEQDELHVGRDAAGEVMAVLVVNAPARLREAQELLRAPISA
jgi:3-phenylpropionate/trans-cinnamate dioxygenase ferredoxin reductase subunit